MFLVHMNDEGGTLAKKGIEKVEKGMLDKLEP